MGGGRLNLTDKITFTNEDCMDLLARTPDKYYELAIVDPPFGIGNNHNRLQRHKNHGTYKNSSIPSAEYFNELRRVSQESIIWGCQYYMAYLNPEGSFIVWDKRADPDIHNMSSCDIAWYSHRSRIRTFVGHWCGAVKFVQEETIHVHQKPVALYKWLLTKYAKPGDKILDTHGGSLSIAIACHYMGFELTACELDPDYFNAAVKRFREQTAQLQAQLT